MASLRAAAKVGAIDVEIHLDLLLVVSQVKVDFEARDPRMTDYLKLVKVTQISKG